MEVSRQTIREALRTLEHAGLVETPKRGAGGGTVVKNAIPETITGLLVDAMRMDSITVDELNDARTTIEVVLVRFAIERADAADIEQLTENTEESRRLIASGVEASQNDLDFHRLLARCSKNRIIELVTDALLCVVTSILSHNPPTLEMSIQSVERHEALIAALARRDTEAAVSEMLQHLSSIDSDIVQRVRAF
jgi:GntR family transcriptional regulator, transcriptional repressor for pyruvate dehydrogenase complex